MRVVTAGLLLVAAALLTVPAMLAMQVLASAGSLVSVGALSAAFVLVVASGSIALFVQLALLALTRPVAGSPAGPVGGAPAVGSPPIASASVAPRSVASAPADAGSSSPVLETRPRWAGWRAVRVMPFLLAALTLLPGCTAAPAAPAAAPAACGPTTPGEVQADAALRDGTAQPAPHRVSVALGSRVRLGVTVDTAAQIHVHGYNLEYQVQPGQPTCIVFVASQAGLFDVEAHPDTLLLQLEVQ
ncbi:hypothetical protein ACWT_5422 [Actinoplanes sp. SE50]|uniref:hypothetical protein n=1 Tax=unclassified Actinoplanes TaxID=2626549 RepID=UPI00023EC69E|nr:MULTISPECIES: hypothetical protein [unclassified Actinoplanes]AEV86439.1 hypothetical protein ACPL_5552 [Actinoplanes sp. SE50/110]ATO84837.1 hypothetical protein ACWT_5422 [Actinoplanes sp. SE50]SLM02246.1 hypothetical protein ACSP50_5485 [Actinoplanes sp. SE50/110]